MSNAEIFKFKKESDWAVIRTVFNFTLNLAELQFGRANVLNSSDCYVSKENSEVVIDISTEVGNYVAVLFTLLVLTGPFGDKFFLEYIMEPK